MKCQLVDLFGLFSWAMFAQELESVGKCQCTMVILCDLSHDRRHVCFMGMPAVQGSPVCFVSVPMIKSSALDIFGRNDVAVNRGMR